MLATYPVDTSAPSGLGGPIAIGGQGSSGKNIVFGFNLGDYSIKVAPMPDGSSFECPAKVLRSGAIAGSGLVPQNAGLGPHQDYQFIRDSTQWTYTLRAIVGGSAVVKVMPAGAQPGQEGEMTLYKGAAALSDIDAGNWTERLIRPFIITAADLANRDTGWPQSGTAPSIDVPSKSVKDNGGDGYKHV